jgi:hypothetical protein
VHSRTFQSFRPQGGGEFCQPRVVSSAVFIPSRAREQMLPDVQNGARIAIHQPETACHPLTTRGPSCTMDCGSSKIEEGLQAHCKNQPSVHGQLAGISKLNPRRLGTRFSKSEVRSDLASAGRAGSADKHCSSRARGDKNSLSGAHRPQPCPTRSQDHQNHPRIQASSEKSPANKAPGRMGSRG